MPQSSTESQEDRLAVDHHLLMRQPGDSSDRYSVADSTSNRATVATLLLFVAIYRQLRRTGEEKRPQLQFVSLFHCPQPLIEDINLFIGGDKRKPTPVPGCGCDLHMVSPPVVAEEQQWKTPFQSQFRDSSGN